MKESTRQIIGIVIYFAIFFGVALLKVSGWAYMLIWMLLTIAWFLFISRVGYMTEDKLKKKIIDRLKYEGYQCKMDEGNIVVTRRGRDQQVFIWSSSNPKLFKVLFQDSFTVGNPDDIHWAGSMVLTESANNRFRTKVRGEDGRYACTYETAIQNADDFINEYKLAWDSIMETIGWISDNWNEAVRRWPAIKEDTPDDKHVVGFRK